MNVDEARNLIARALGLDTSQLQPLCGFTTPAFGLGEKIFTILDGEVIELNEAWKNHKRPAA